MGTAANILVFYGSYRPDRMGIRLAKYVAAGLTRRGDDVEFMDTKAIGLPMLDRMYKGYAEGSAPPVLETLAQKIRGAPAFVFNGRIQLGYAAGPEETMTFSPKPT